VVPPHLSCFLSSPVLLRAGPFSFWCLTGRGRVSMGGRCSSARFFAGLTPSPFVLADARQVRNQAESLRDPLVGPDVRVPFVPPQELREGAEEFLRPRLALYTTIIVSDTVRLVPNNRCSTSAQLLIPPPLLCHFQY